LYIKIAIYGALQSFYTKFPFLASNDFVIAGESYGGVYVPMTAKAIVEHNAAKHPGTVHINLKKWAVGNGINEFAG
jgi:carboxypeptidase C (cathepsin A)